MLSPMLPIVRQAAKLAGGINPLANKLGVSRQLLYAWPKRVPAERVLAMEAATDGKLNRSAIRPDIYPPTKRNGKAA